MLYRWALTLYKLWTYNCGTGSKLELKFRRKQNSRSQKPSLRDSYHQSLIPELIASTDLLEAIDALTA